MHENICYTRPILKDVICRLDYGARVEGFVKALPQKLAAAALKQFPIAEPQKGHKQQIRVSGTIVETKTEEAPRWTYHGKNREKSLVIQPDALIVTNSKYDSYEKFRDDIDGVVSVLFNTQEDLTIARFGLRYINVLNVDEGEPLAWSDYIDEQMLGIIDIHKDQGALSRVFHIVEFNYDVLQAKFQFGVPNPDYPALIKRKQFVLDIDAYVNGALTHEDVSRSMEQAHEKIQDLFESSITNKTRQLMQPGQS